MLVEEGKANLAVQDRWGATPLDEAMRAGSRAVMDYLQGLNAPTQKDDDRTVEFLYAASRGDTAKLRHVSAICITMNLVCMHVSSYRRQQCGTMKHSVPIDTCFTLSVSWRISPQHDREAEACCCAADDPVWF